jgi:hypothetical protein
MYQVALQKFVQRLTEDQRSAALVRGQTVEDVNGIAAFLHTGRKYDKVCISRINVDTGSISSEVRYFVDKKTGSIYGARSRLAPNFKWYFGEVETCNLWDWSGYHGVPINDPTIRAVGSYGGYVRYMRI